MEEGDTLNFGLSTPSRNCPSWQKSHFGELVIDLEEMNEDDELMTVYPCPYCSEDLDLLQLCCHIDLDHPVEAQSGICPVCATWVVTNMVDHITAQHENIFKISFLICMIIMLSFIQDLLILWPCCFLLLVSFYYTSFLAFVLYPTNYATSFTKDYSLLKSKHYKHESNSTHSFSKKDQDDDLWPSIAAGLSPEMSTSKSAHDPLLAFLYTGAADDRGENVHPDTSSEDSSIEEIHSQQTLLERDVQPSLSDKDRIEKAQRSEFVQGLLMSILDPDF